MSQRLELPPLPTPIETQNAVRQRARTRIRLVGGVLVGLLAFIGARGAQLCISPSVETVRRASVQRWDEVKLPARRGEILDRHGRRLATSVADPNIVADPGLLTSDAQRRGLARSLARILEVDEDTLREKLGRPGRYVRLARRVQG